MAPEGLSANGSTGASTRTAERALDLLRQLPPTFTYTQARQAGLSHRGLYGLRGAGIVEPLGRGLYRRVDAVLTDPTLTEVAVRAPLATLCLTSALVEHDLSDAIPTAPHLALPRGSRFPSTTGPVTWHAFAAETFELGRIRRRVDSQLQLGLYNAERTIVDTFRLRHLTGSDEAYEALRRWLSRRGSQPSTLLTMAGHFPRTLPSIRHALEVLL
ncbi:type IV toxin-antitoxin system AbiEi family antitoxin domain-containing protein [Jiangella asiatica]|uniref:type IV toxin-antitoxin system AbiEi family antitoxin domain-containing protein n=1 Tax=Jiangella asiatica TaxID=2530372 RepID=UPI00193E39A6|nr:type IV toxin-antitoxin system AbiEi family antitoxin domain-containing protein [Jiangella asiatica]